MTNSSDIGDDFPGPYAVFEVEYVQHDHPIFIPEVRRVADGATGTLVAATGGYELQDVQRPDETITPDVMPTLVAGHDLTPSRVFDSQGSGTYRLGQVVNVLD